VTAPAGIAGTTGDPYPRRMTIPSPTLWLRLVRYQSHMIRRGRARRRRRAMRSLGRYVLVYLLVGLGLLVMALMW